MARIPLVSARRAGLGARFACYFTRRNLTRLAGTRTEKTLEPVQVYAHVPRLLAGYGTLEQATAALTQLDHRSRALAELKTATVVQCECCIDLGSRVARRWGLTDTGLLALPD